jgi:hypothetical protein
MRDASKQRRTAIVDQKIAPIRKLRMVDQK